MSCIYPGPHGAISDEHYLPRALGQFKGFEPLYDRLCRDCNKRIGDTTEVQFLRAGPIAFFRWLVGNEGRDGPMPSPYYRGAGGAPPLYMTGRCASFDYDLLFEVVQGSEDVFPLRQVIFDHKITGHTPVPILDRMKGNPDALIDYLKHYGIEGAKPIHAFAAPDEIQWLTDLLVKAVGTTPGGEWATTDFQPQRIELVVNVGVTEAHFRAVAKIVFHYALKVFPDLSGLERQFDPIKQFIWEGGQTGHFVSQENNQYVANFRRGYRPSHWSHILSVTRDYNEIVGRAQFFAGPKSLPPPYRVRVGPNPSKIASRTVQQAHQFVILPSSLRPSGYDGVMENLQPANYVLLGFA
jgi:hypothetical protein